MQTKKIFVTGGCGFIGSHFVRLALGQGYQVLNLDALTYAASPETLKDLESHPHYTFSHGQIQNQPLVKSLFEKHQPLYVVNFAAETHVDRSIHDPQNFMSTNIMGTFVLLEEFKAYLKKFGQSGTRFLHISTDEVFGSAADGIPFREGDPYNPSSPYAASKAASDHLVKAYFKTYDLPVLLTNCTNNYGPYQFPEKLIPHMISCALQEKPLPIYGNGLQVRDWLHVEDHAKCLLKVLEQGGLGESYNIAGGGVPVPNIKVVSMICDILDALNSRKKRASYGQLITHVTDRPGHDFCYALNAEKIKNELGVSPTRNFEEGLRETVIWYLNNPSWPLPPKA